MRRLHTEGSEHHRDEPCDHAFLERPVEDWEKGRHQHIHLHRKAREATALWMLPHSNTKSSSDCISTPGCACFTPHHHEAGHPRRRACDCVRVGFLTCLLKM